MKNLRLKEPLLLEYRPSENAFYTQTGEHLSEIQHFVRPSDLYLFRRDHGTCNFPMRRYPEITVEIFIEE